MMPPRALAPSWVMPRAKFDLDFENGRYWGGDIWLGDATISTKARASLITPDNGGIVQYVEYPDGVLRTFPQYANRVVPGRGLLVEDFGNNWALWCRDFTNAAWVASSVTATKNQAGADLASNSASSLTASGSNGTILQSVTLTSRSLLASCYVKRLVGTGTVEMTVDNGATWTNITSQVVTGRYTRVAIPLQTLANPRFRLPHRHQHGLRRGGLLPGRGRFAADRPVQPASHHDHDRHAPERAHLLLQQRLDPERRAADDLRNLLRRQTVRHFLQVLGQPRLRRRRRHHDGHRRPPSRWASRAAARTARRPPTPSPRRRTSANTGTDNWNKLAARTTGFGSQSCLNGGAITALASTAASKVAAATLSQATWTHGSFGNNGSGTTGAPLNGYVARVALWDLELTDGQLLEFTR